ncbi:MAG: extracellular solute-binding protein [Chloroflexi bacterium]|nr:extracellular solute-binding protein [Chloroflexota bacterium]
MKGTVLTIGLALIALLLVLGACAPGPTAAPVPVSAPPKSAPTTAPRVASPADAQSTEWQKVVDAAKKEGSVTLYSYAFTGDLGLALSEAFKQRYGIKVEIVTGRGAEMVERIKTEQRMKSVTADIQEGSSTHNLNSKIAGSTVATLDIPALKEAKEVWYASPLTPDPDGHVIAYNVTVYTPYVNTRLVKESDMPRTFKDFLNPKWKGQIVASDPDLSTTEYNHFLPLLDARIVDEEFLRAVGRQGLQFVTGEVQRGEKLSRGELPLTMTASTASMTRFVGQGAPIKAQRMKEGISGDTISMVRIKNGPHPNAAQVFMDWLLSQEGQDVHGKVRFMASLRRDVTDYTPEPARSDLNGLVVANADQQTRQANLFKDKWLSKMWGK